MTDRISADVAIVGGGPVGLSLAMDLAWRGIDVVVAELRAAGEPPSVKCNHVSSRTMEIFRRLGLAKAVRAAGLPDDYPNDVAFRTRATGFELTRIPIPCREDRFSDTSGPDGWWPTPEPAHRINQIYLEPILFDYAAAAADVTILSRTRIDGFEQGEDGVTAAGIELDSGQRVEIDARFLIGCDGGRSEVRRGDPAGAVDLHPRARADRSDQGTPRLDELPLQPRARRQPDCHRRPRALAGAQLSAGRRG
jgi:2-polyprenyl-6-methoxyphenol hydroxylase-like FAD-dependent oxidoreductase